MASSAELNLSSTVRPAMAQGQPSRELSRVIGGGGGLQPDRLLEAAASTGVAAWAGRPSAIHPAVAGALAGALPAVGSGAGALPAIALAQRVWLGFGPPSSPP